MSRSCPECQKPMKTENFHGVEIDVCPEGAGIWFDADELREMLAADPLAMAVVEDRYLPHVEQHRTHPGALHCPNCDGVLHGYRYQYNSPIELDACDDCGGFWVQDGELHKMQEWNSTHRHASTTEELHKLTLAKAALEHDRELHLHTNLRSFFGLLRQHKPLWMTE